MANRPKLVMVTAVWGEWHLRAHFEMNLPTLLAPGNFPALVEFCDIHYIIYTCRRDLRFVKDAPINATLRQLMSLEVRLLDDDDLENPIAAHHLAWSKAIEDAKRSGSLILLMPPDVAWSENSFQSVGRKLAEGYRAIFMTYLRVEEESFSATIRRQPKAVDGSLCIPPKRLVEMGLNCLHPLMASCLADSEFFPRHPEMMIWAVPKEGLLLRILAREMFLFDPRKVELNRSQLPAKPLDEGEGYFFDESEDLFAVSLAPHGKDANWHLTPSQADPKDVGGWWTVYDSAINDFVVSHRLRWHFKPVTESLWQRVERRSDAFIQKAMGVREGIRFWQIARRLGLSTAAGLIATAAQTGVMAHALVTSGRAAILLPTNEAFAALPESELNALHFPQGARSLARLIRRHILPLESGFETHDDPLGRLAGEGKSSVRHSDGTHSLGMSADGVTVVSGGQVIPGPVFESTAHRIYLVDRILR